MESLFFAATFAAVSVLSLPHAARAATLTGVSPVTDRVLLLSFDDAVTVRHESKGGTGADGFVETAPLDTAKAALPVSYRITSTDDPAYRGGLAPSKVGRKSKGHDFVKVEGGETKWAMYDDVYLVLPAPLRRGKTYTISAGALSSKPGPVTLRYEEPKLRSETVHVNQIGYVPSAPKSSRICRTGWAIWGRWIWGTTHPSGFRCAMSKTGREMFSGPVTLRRRAGEPDGGQPEEATQNYAGADVWQCDFSAFRTPGEYVVTVDRIGSSFRFVSARMSTARRFGRWRGDCTISGAARH
jgi:hypothetical protein